MAETERLCVVEQALLSHLKVVNNSKYSLPCPETSVAYIAGRRGQYQRFAAGKQVGCILGRRIPKKSQIGKLSLSVWLGICHSCLLPICVISFTLFLTSVDVHLTFISVSSLDSQFLLFKPHFRLLSPSLPVSPSSPLPPSPPPTLSLSLSLSLCAPLYLPLPPSLSLTHSPVIVRHVRLNLICTCK